jgi:hypothetical protein
MPITSANIDIGDLPNDGTGDPLRVAFDKINNNFDELALLVPGGPTGAIQYKDANALPAGTANFTYNESNNTINFGGNFIPTEDSTIDIGANSLRIGNLYIANSALRLGNIHFVEDGNTISFPISVFPSQQASLEVNNLTVNGNLNLENTTFQVFTITTTTNTANQIIFETPASGFNSGTFKIISREASTNNSQSVEIELTKSNDNSYVKMVAYGTTFEVPASDIWVTKYNADQGFGNVRLMVSPARNSSVTHTVSYQIVNA